jgi:hypothetical protein
VLVTFRTRDHCPHLIYGYRAGVARSAHPLLHAAAGPVQPIRRLHGPCYSSLR